jgi:hypothetical protein
MTVPMWYSSIQMRRPWCVQEKLQWQIGIQAKEATSDRRSINYLWDLEECLYKEHIYVYIDYCLFMAELTTLAVDRTM